MDDKNKKFCPNCSQLYNINLSSAKPKNNLPLFLPCGHSMCENCILNIIKCMEPIECKVCHTDVEFKSNDAMLVVQNPIKLHNFFPVNKFMLGELTLHLIKKPESIPKSHDHFSDLKAILKNETAKGQCLECQATSTKMCQQCTTILCDNCFNKSHKNFVIFKNHELKAIDIARQPNYCTIHKEKSLDYYCHDCTKAICIDCMMIGGEKSCKNHNVVPKEEVNDTFLKDLKEISPQIDEIYRRLTKTAVDIGYLLLNYENDTGSATELIKTIADIDQHFSKYFSLVQKHKEEVINIISNLKCSEEDSLHKAKIEVVNAAKRARDVLKQIEVYSDPSLVKQANLPALLEEAKQIIKTPWYLNKNDSNKEALKINVNEDLCTLISDYIHLEGNVTSVYKLYSINELGDDVEIPPAPKAPVYPPELPKDVREESKPKIEKEVKPFHKKVPKYRTKSGSVSSLNSLGSEGSNKNYITHNNSHQQPLVQPVSPFPESQLPQQLREGSHELIYISHIVDPHNFYVQRACHQGIVKEMLREFRNAVSFTKPSSNHISIGKTYLAYNKVDCMWQRCRVIGIDRSDTNKSPVIHVFCFDFGSVEIVSIDGLRLIPAQRIQCPYPLALNCSLANCEPKTGAWTSEDSILIQNIIDNKQAVIYIRRIITTSTIDLKLECDVVTFDHGVSLAHALVFHERAKMPNPKLKYPVLTSIKEKPKLYMSHNDFKSDTPEAVYLTHVVSPDKFFVRKQYLQAAYEKISEELEQEYTLASNSGTVYLPEVDMVCVVNVSKCGSNLEEGASYTWARGVITALHGRGRVQVFLPDNGIEISIHWNMLRYIHHKFTAIRAIATECHLAGVTPLSKKWTTGSVELLKRFEGNLLELQVEDNRNWTNQNRNSIGVILYDKNDPDNVICINQEMIRHKYAVSFGVYMFNKSPVEEQVITNKSPLKQSAPKPKKNKITILKKSNENKIVEADLEVKDKGPLRLEAKILHYQSPSLIYVSLVHQQKGFNELFENMQKYYSKNKLVTNKVWKTGDTCCTICNQSQTWRRAVIMEVQNENAKVFYRDFACIETVPLSGLKELTEEFDKPANAAIMCHLHGIMPAVGEEWPSLTKEFLKELLDAYKRVFITKIGNFKENSMPIEIWVYHTIQGAALEPNKSEWRCLNTRIIEQGLGVPDKSQIKVENKENTENDKGDTLSFLNITGSVNEWLQLDPVPLIPVTKKLEKESNRDSPASFQESEDMYTKPQDEADTSNVMYISDWLPPEPFMCKEFTGVPTYIDNDGVIYLHDIRQQDTLDLIRKALDVRFKGPDPKAKFMKWTVGEPCVALYYLDNKYYRGRVTDVNTENSTCFIHYVDYGNDESCEFSNIRKSVPLHQIPIQAHKCILNRIRPVGKQWDRNTLDYIHKSVVEKQCYVQIVGEPQNGITPIELKFNKLCINDHLVDFEMAEYTDGSKAVVKKFAHTSNDKTYKEKIAISISDSGPDYIVVDESDTVESMYPSDDSFDINCMKGVDWNKLIADETSSIDSSYLTYPKYTDEEFICNITIINNVNTLELSIISDEETTNVYESMFEELQSESQSLPPLNGIFENKACIAIFPEDGKWYRASILQFSEAKNQIKVRYIDYGNVEVISLADTREITDDWARLPPATISAKLYGVQVNPDLDVQVVLQEYGKIFLDKGPFNVRVITYENSIPLVEMRNDKNELIYKQLIEDNVLLKCK